MYLKHTGRFGTQYWIAAIFRSEDTRSSRQYRRSLKRMVTKRDRVNGKRSIMED